MPTSVLIFRSAILVVYAHRHTVRSELEKGSADIAIELGATKPGSNLSTPRNNMNRKTVSFLAMIAVVAVPTPGSAGWLGLFKRCHSKPKCVRSYPSPTEQVVGAPPCDLRESYTCQVCFEAECEPEEGEPYAEMICSDELTGANCEDLIYEAYENALAKMPEYCYESGPLEATCRPECVENRVCADDCSTWYATYTIQFCNGLRIEKTAKANSCEKAKLISKAVVCGLARKQCRGPIRCCNWKIWSVEEAATDTAAQ